MTRIKLIPDELRTSNRPTQIALLKSGKIRYNEHENRQKVGK